MLSSSQRTKHIEVEHDFIREKLIDITIDALEVRGKNILSTFSQSRHPRLPSSSLYKIWVNIQKIILRGSVKNKFDSISDYIYNNLKICIY